MHHFVDVPILNADAVPLSETGLVFFTPLRLPGVL